MSKTYDLIILGGGAAGLSSAIFAARKGLRVCILEHASRVGKKILSTGNGKCNLANEFQGGCMYRGSDPDFAVSVIERFNVADTVGFFKEIGVPTVSQNGYVYPRSLQASTVLDGLRLEAARLGVTTVLDVIVTKILKKQNGFQWNAELDGKSISFLSGSALLAVGGLAAPKTGSDGSANALIRSLGHTLTKQYPVLVPFETDLPYRKALAGVRSDMRIKLMYNGQVIQEEFGQLQWTEYGISGIPVFQISHLAGKLLTEQKTPEVSIDLLPDLSKQDLVEELIYRKKSYGSFPAGDAMNGFLNKKLMTQLMKACHISMNDEMRQVPDQKLKALASLTKHVSMKLTKSRSFEQAQTTGGGIPTQELYRDLSSKRCKGLFVAGEIIDIDGRCGGYNLQWAWSSAFVAANAAAAYLRNESVVSNEKHRFKNQ